MAYRSDVAIECGKMAKGFVKETLDRYGETYITYKRNNEYVFVLPYCAWDSMGIIETTLEDAAFKFERLRRDFIFNGDIDTGEDHHFAIIRIGENIGDIEFINDPYYCALNVSVPDEFIELEEERVDDEND